MQQTNYSFLYNLGRVLRKYPNVDLVDAFSQGQLDSKKWLIEELEKQNIFLGTVFVLGGWYGTLSSMMFDSELRFEKIRSFDIDPQCADVADTMNRSHVMAGWLFKASTADMYDMNYDICKYETLRFDGSSVIVEDTPTTIINTSCEHIQSLPNWLDRIPTGKLIVLQSNNYREVKEHINCVDNLDEFIQQANLSKVFYSGELPCPQYNRFMIIGEK